MTKENVEEILEALWIAGEEGWEATPGLLLEHAHGDVGPEDLGEAESEGLVDTTGERVVFTPVGEATAQAIVRSHRLAERLLADVLQVSSPLVESSACEFEHCLSPEVTDSICTLLGHPTVCPHGASIPPGSCCSKLATEVGPLVRRLADVTVGERVRVVFIAADRGKRLERLGSLGVHPGSLLRLTQRRPSYIVEVDQTTLAIEREVAEGVYVRRQNDVT
ncbi:MAG: metal-dependent transcriptional regulator [Planctomycetota bacterium]